MAFYTGRIVREPAMSNPTVVVLTDRNDVDDQLFATFANCADLLRQPPAQADTRVRLRQLLSTASGGVVFTTIQKFLPDEKGDRHQLLSERRNIVVIADEAHRSQYDFIDGFAAHMRDALPNASFIGFTGTPVENADASTRAVFGDHISVYDIQRSVHDEATVPIYYESRLARLALDDRQKPRIDPDFEEATEGEEVERKERLKTRWAQLEAVVGANRRISQVAADIVDHYEARLDAMDGKAMVVCMSRRICVDLHDELLRLRPDWHHPDDDEGAVKVVMTGSASDGPEWQPHIRNKARREAIGKRFRDPDDPLRIVLVETNASAVEVLGDETLRAIACELVETVRGNVTIDWTMRENVRARLRTLVRRTLRRHGYPPDKQEKATQTVLEQAEALSAVWAQAA